MRKRYRDKTKCKDSPEISKFVKGVPYKIRHAQRFLVNENTADQFKEHCKEQGYTFRILNEGEHWQVKYKGDCFDWWPRTAKLVINQNWKNGIHVHDHTQLATIIARTK